MSCRVLLAGPRGSFEAWKFNMQNAVFELLRAPRGVKIGPQRPLGAFLEHLGLMQASWSVLGSHLGPHFGTLFGPKPAKSRFQLLFSAPEASKSAPRASLEAF